VPRTTTFAMVAVMFGVASLLSSCSSQEASPSERRVVVLVSGVAATTPFTTPTSPCRTGFSAGNTWAFLRDNLTERGYEVYTAPSSLGGGVVVETTSESDGPFGDCPEQLPESVTANAIGPVDRTASSVARFIQYLHDEYGVTSADVVGHSLGGLIGRAAIREVRLNNVPVEIRSYTTLGSPWDGVMLADPIDPAQPISACDGSKVCEGFLTPLLTVPGISMLTSTLVPANTAVWNTNQVGVLDGIPVTLVAGTYFTKPGGIARKWPNDGAIQESAALATATPDSVLPHRTCFVKPYTHSYFVSKAVGAPDDTAMTWNDDVATIISNAIDNASDALSKPNRVGCPPPPNP